MRDHGYFSHRSLEGHEYEQWTLGETIAWAPQSASTAAAIVQAFMDSPSHRRVLLDAREVELGIGVVRGTPTGLEDPEPGQDDGRDRDRDRDKEKGGKGHGA